MRFPGETQNLAINMAAKHYAAERDTISTAGDSKEKPPVRIKDLRGVKCPINFAKTKIQLAAMKSGQTLEIYLDDGEPIDNVPGSVKREGHKILRQEKVSGYWTVLIEKV